MIGKTKLTKRDKEVLTGLVNYVCQNCLRHEMNTGPLEIHRIKRKSHGGKYCPNNCLVLCKECHKEFHANESGCH